LSSTTGSDSGQTTGTGLGGNSLDSNFNSDFATNSGFDQSSNFSPGTSTTGQDFNVNSDPALNQIFTQDIRSNSPNLNSNQSPNFGFADQFTFNPDQYFVLPSQQIYETKSTPPNFVAITPKPQYVNYKRGAPVIAI
jgi:hypothetical protein